MKRFVTLVPFVLYGLAAAASPLSEADIPTAPTIRSDASLSAPAGHSGADGTSSRPEHDVHRQSDYSPRAAKRGVSAIASLDLTPAQRVQLLAELRLVYGQLAAFSTTRDTGLLNNLLHLLSGAVPPLSGLLEGLREALVGDSDSVTVLDRLAVAIGMSDRTRVPTPELWLMLSQGFSVPPIPQPSLSTNMVPPWKPSPSRPRVDRAKPLHT